MCLSLRKDAQNQLTQLSVAKTDEDQQVAARQAARVTALEAEIAAIDERLGQLASIPDQLNQTQSGDNQEQYELSRISSTVRANLERVGVFRPSGLINEWVNRVNMIYKMVVKPKVPAIPAIEQDFLSQVVLMLPYGAQSKFEEETSWKAFVPELKGHYQADISIFQHLSKVWGIDLHGTKWADQAQKLGSCLNESKSNIKAHFASNSKILTGDVAFDLIGAMIMAESVRKNSPDTYRLMLDSLDSAFTCSEVARKAASS